MQPQTKVDPATLFLATRHRATLPQIPKIAGSGMWPIHQEVERAGIEQVGSETLLYYGADGNPATEFDLLLAIPINERPATLSDGFEIVDTSPFHCISVEYIGSMPNIHTGYKVLMDAIAGQNLRPTVESREIYKKWVDFDSDENVTELQIGID